MISIHKIGPIIHNGNCMKERANFLARIYRLKMLIAGASLAGLGLILTLLANWFALSGHSPELVIAVLESVADVLLVTGAIGIAVDFFTGRDKDAADTERTRSVLRELTPDFVDAVVRGFSVEKDDLARVASPALLDEIASNVLSLRLGDDQFAREIYADLREQAIRAPERWYDVDVSIRLSSIDERSALGAPLFDQLIEWEYTTVPSHAVRRFTSVSDRDEFYDLVTDLPATSAWFMPASTGADASSRASYELISFTVEGEDLPIKRSARKTGQTYTVRLDEGLIAKGAPVRIRSVYRAVGTRNAHRLFVEVPVPARDLSLTVDYTDTEISRMSVTDAVTSLAKPQVSRIPEHLHGREIKVDLPGWLMPRSGFTFVWTLRSEEPTSAAPGASKAA